MGRAGVMGGRLQRGGRGSRGGGGSDAFLRTDATQMAILGDGRQSRGWEQVAPAANRKWIRGRGKARRLPSGEPRAWKRRLPAAAGRHGDPCCRQQPRARWAKAVCLEAGAHGASLKPDQFGGDQAGGAGSVGRWADWAAVDSG